MLVVPTLQRTTTAATLPAFSPATARLLTRDLTLKSAEMHVPPEQSWVPVQGVPQAPQFAKELLVSVQVASPQSAKGAVQAQAPETQDVMVVSQAIVQSPQCLSSDVKSAQSAPHTVAGAWHEQTPALHV